MKGERRSSRERNGRRYKEPFPLRGHGRDMGHPPGSEEWGPSTEGQGRWGSIPSMEGNRQGDIEPSFEGKGQSGNDTSFGGSKALKTGAPP